jgi:hypothetical protein
LVGPIATSTNHAPREPQPDQGSGHRQQRAFGEEEPRDGESARAERAANRHLAPSGVGADQEQVGDVRAGDEQDEPDGGEQYPEGAFDSTNGGFMKRACGGPHLQVFMKPDTPGSFG